MRPVIPPLRTPHGKSQAGPRVEPALNGATQVPRDPAPSRMAYRFQRLWLTPIFRTLLRVGLPVFSLIFGAALFMSSEDRREAVVLKVSEIRRSIEERPEFMVNLMAIDGASEDLAQDVREILPIDFPLSSFDLDLQQLRELVAGLSAVDQVEMRVRSGGILQIEIVERLPAVVWRSREAIELLDAEGQRVAPLIARAERPDLPLLTGTGADRAVPEALALLAAASPIAGRVRGLVRQGERRWDLILDRDQRVMLPADNPVQALERVLALNSLQDILDRDLVAIDMRLKNRPTLRLAAPAVDAMRQTIRLELGVVSQ